MSFINTNEITTIIKDFLFSKLSKDDYRYRLLLNIPCKIHHVGMTYVHLKINANAYYALCVTNLGLEIRVDSNSSIIINRTGDIMRNLRVNLVVERCAIINN